MRTRRSRESWRALVALWLQSGMDAEAFAAQHGVGRSTLQWWRYRLRRDGDGPTGDRAPARFVELTAVPSIDPPPCDAGAPSKGASPTAALHLVLPGGAVAVFEVLPSPEYLSSLLRAARGVAA